jgi:hypothetical protein
MCGSGANFLSACVFIYRPPAEVPGFWFVVLGSSKDAESLPGLLELVEIANSLNQGFCLNGATSNLPDRLLDSLPIPELGRVLCKEGIHIRGELLWQRIAWFPWKCECQPEHIVTMLLDVVTFNIGTSFFSRGQIQPRARLERDES